MPLLWACKNRQGLTYPDRRFAAARRSFPLCSRGARPDERRFFPDAEPVVRTEQWLLSEWVANCWLKKCAEHLSEYSLICLRVNSPSLFPLLRGVELLDLCFVLSLIMSSDSIQRLSALDHVADAEEMPMGPVHFEEDGSTRMTGFSVCP